MLAQGAEGLVLGGSGIPASSRGSYSARYGVRSGPPPVVDQPGVGDGEDEGPQACVAAPDVGQLGQDVDEDVLGEGLGVIHTAGPEIAEHGGGNDAVDGAEA